MTANVQMSETFSQQATKINELAVMTQDDGMNNFIKVLDTTNSTSNTTGSIITVGGVGIGKSVVVREHLNLHGNIHANGNITSDGSLTFGDADTDNVVFGADINSHIIPNTDDTYDLGSSTQKWKDLYVNGVAYVDSITLNGTAITSTGAELNKLTGVTADAADLNLLDGVTASTAELNYNDIGALGIAEVSKTVTSDASGNITFVNGTNDIDIASHDAGTNGLKLGGTLVTKSAADINNLSTDAEATAVAVSMAIALG